jgi:hypothetical protein
VNFTSCCAFNSGSAFTVYDDVESFSANDLILCSLTGDTGIDSYCETLPTVDHCNFYNNKLLNNHAVLYGHNYGMKIDNCIFDSNSRDVRMSDIESSGNRFQIKNSVFSGTLPTESKWRSLGANNYVETVTALWVIIRGPERTDWRTNSPTATSTHSPTGIPSQLFNAS